MVYQNCMMAKYANMPLCNSNMPLWNSNMPLCNSNMPLCHYAIMPLCHYAIMLFCSFWKPRVSYLINRIETRPGFYFLYLITIMSAFSS